MKSREEIMQALDGAKELQVQQAKFMVNPAEMAVQAGINAPLIATTLALILEVALDIRELAQTGGMTIIGPDAEPTDFRCYVRAVAFDHRHCSEYDDTDGNCLRFARGEKDCTFVDDGVPAIEVDGCGDPDAVREAARETLLRAQKEKEKGEQS